MNILESKIAIIGLGYVGLPLAIEFGKKYGVVGFDINQSRIDELTEGKDRTNEADLIGLQQATSLFAETGKKRFVLFFKYCRFSFMQYFYSNSSNAH
jgi:UDP-N-acetyl-D-galactosamine dehydrogenase